MSPIASTPMEGDPDSAPLTPPHPITPSLHFLRSMPVVGISVLPTHQRQATLTTVVSSATILTVVAAIAMGLALLSVPSDAAASSATLGLATSLSMPEYEAYFNPLTAANATAPHNVTYHSAPFTRQPHHVLLERVLSFRSTSRVGSVASEVSALNNLTWAVNQSTHQQLAPTNLAASGGDTFVGNLRKMILSLLGASSTSLPATPTAPTAADASQYLRGRVTGVNALSAAYFSDDGEELSSGYRDGSGAGFVRPSSMYRASVRGGHFCSVHMRELRNRMVNGGFQIGTSTAPVWVTAADTKYPYAAQFFDEAPSLRRHVAPRAASIVGDTLGNVLERWRVVESALPYSLRRTMPIDSATFGKLSGITNPATATRCPLLNISATPTELNQLNAISVINAWLSGTSVTYDPDTRVLAAVDSAVAHYQRSFEVLSHTLLASLSSPSLLSTNLSAAVQASLWGNATKASLAKAATGKAPALALAASVYAEAAHCLALTASLAAVAFEDEPLLALLPTKGSSGLRAPLPPTNPTVRNMTHPMTMYLLSETYESSASLLVQLSNDAYEARMGRVNSRIQAAITPALQFVQAVAASLIPLYDAEQARLAALDATLTNSAVGSLLGKRWTAPLLASSRLATATQNSLLCSITTLAALGLPAERILSGSRVAADNSFPAGAPSDATIAGWNLTNQILTTPLNVSQLLTSYTRTQLVNAMGFGSTADASQARYSRTWLAAQMMKRLSTGAGLDCFEDTTSKDDSLYDPSSVRDALLKLMSDADLIDASSAVTSSSTAAMVGAFSFDTATTGGSRFSLTSTPFVAPAVASSADVTSNATASIRDRRLSELASLFAHLNPNTTTGKYVPNTTLTAADMLPDPSLGSRMTAEELAAYLLTLPRTIPGDPSGLPTATTDVVVVCPAAGYYRAVNPDSGTYYCAQCYNTYPDFLYCPEGYDAQFRCENKPLSSADEASEISASGMVDYNDWISVADDDEPLQSFRAGYVPQGRGWWSPSCPFRCLNPSYYQLRSNDSYLPDVDSDTIVTRPAMCSDASRRDSVLSLAANLSTLSAAAQAAVILAGTCADGNMGYGRDYCAETPIGRYAETDGAVTFKMCALDGLGIAGDDLSQRWGKESPSRLRAEDVVFSTSGRGTMPSSCGFQMRSKAAPVALGSVPLVPGITAALSVLHPSISGTPLPLGLASDSAANQYVNVSNPLSSPFLALPYLARLEELITPQALRDPLNQYDDAVGGNHVASIRSAVGEGVSISVNVQLNASEIQNAFQLLEDSTDYSRVPNYGTYTNGSTGVEDTNQQSIATDLVTVSTTDSISAADFMGKRVWSLTLVMQRAAKSTSTAEGGSSFSPTTAYLLLLVNATQVTPAAGGQRSAALTYRSSPFLLMGASDGAVVDPATEFKSFGVSVDIKEQLVYFLINDETVPTGCMTAAQAAVAATSGFNVSGTNMDDLVHMLPGTRRCRTPTTPVPVYGEPFGLFPRSKRSPLSALDQQFFKNFATAYLHVGGWMGFVNVLGDYGPLLVADDHANDMADLSATGRPVSTIGLPDMPRTFLRNYTMFPGNITALTVTPQRHIAAVAVQLEELGLLDPLEVSVNADVWDYERRAGVPRPSAVTVLAPYNGSKCGFGFIGSSCEVECPVGSPSSTGEPTQNVSLGCECLEVSRVMTYTGTCQRTAPPFEAPDVSLVAPYAITASTSRDFRAAATRNPPPPPPLSRSFAAAATNDVVDYDDGFYHSPLEGFGTVRLATSYELDVPPADWSMQTNVKATVGLGTLRMKCGSAWVGEGTTEQTLWSLSDMSSVAGTLTPTAAVDPTAVGSGSPLTALRVLSPRPSTLYGPSVFTSVTTTMQPVLFQMIPFASFYGENCTVYGRVQDSPNRRAGAVSVAVASTNVLAQASPVVPLHAMSLPNYTVITPLQGKSTLYNQTFFLRIRNYTLARLPLAATDGEENLDPAFVKATAYATQARPASTNLFLSPSNYTRRTEINRALARAQEAMREVHFHVVATSSTYHPRGDPSGHYSRSPSPTRLADARLVNASHFLFEKVFSASKLATRALGSATLATATLSQYAAMVTDPATNTTVPVFEPFIDTANPTEIVVPFRLVSTMVTEAAMRAALQQDLSGTVEGSGAYNLAEPPSAYRPVWLQVRVVSAAQAKLIDDRIQARPRASAAIPYTSLVDSTRAARNVSTLATEIGDPFIVNATAFHSSPWTSVVLYPLPFLPSALKAIVASNSGSDFAVQTSVSFALTNPTFVPWSWPDISTNAARVASNPSRRSTTYQLGAELLASYEDPAFAAAVSGGGQSAPGALVVNAATSSVGPTILLVVGITLSVLSAALLGTLMRFNGWIPFIGYCCEEPERRDYDILSDADVEALRREVVRVFQNDPNHQLAIAPLCIVDGVPSPQQVDTAVLAIESWVDEAAAASCAPDDEGVVSRRRRPRRDSSKLRHPDEEDELEMKEVASAVVTPRSSRRSSSRVEDVVLTAARSVPQSVVSRVESINNEPFDATPRASEQPVTPRRSHHGARASSSRARRSEPIDDLVATAAEGSKPRNRSASRGNRG